MEALSSVRAAPSIIEDRSLRHVHIKKYRVCNHLGKGGFANVYRVQSIDSSKVYACKIINKSKLISNEHKRKLVSEIKLHQSLQHKNIVKFERHFEDKKNVYILLECCSNGSLMELSIKRTKFIEHEVRYFMDQILIAIKYLHSLFIIHRDLKLGNILLDKNLNIKICDFGLAAKLQFDTERKTTICGTPNYTAPEILNQRKSGEGHSYEVDIWSIGVIMFTLLTGKPPFETRNIKETYRRIKKIKYEFPCDSDKYISVHAKNLISQIFTKEPRKRPNLCQIKMHPFFKELPTPKSLPLLILKRTPTNKELFDSEPIDNINNKNNISTNYSSLRPPLVSTGYTQKNNNNNNNNHHHNNNYHTKRYQPLQSYKISKKSDNNNKEEKEDNYDINNNKKLHSQKLEIIKNVNNDNNIKMNKKNGLKVNKKKQKDDIISIIKYVDYTKKYGLGYILSNGYTGIYFNDSTKILLYKNKENILYIDNEENKIKCLMSKYPTNLKKKVTLLKHFTDYLWKKNYDENNKQNDKDINEELNKLTLSIKNDNDNNDNDDNDDNKIYLKTTVSDQYCVLFKLSNNMVQVNFTDSSQIIIIDSSVMYKDKIGNHCIFELNQLFESNKKDLKKRCKYTQQLLQKIASKKFKND